MTPQQLFSTPTFQENIQTNPTMNMLSSLINPNKPRLGLAILGGFNPPITVNISNMWTLIREGGKKEPNIFPPPINDIKWQGFYTKEVSGYGRKLYWICGYGLLPENSVRATMIMFQWWHTEPVNITDYRMISSEDWDNANIYITSVERLEDVFINTQLSLFNGVNSKPKKPTEYVDVINLNNSDENLDKDIENENQNTTSN